MVEDYKRLALEISEHLGGWDNIGSFTHCMTRLRVKVNDHSFVDFDGLKNTTGVIGVVQTEQVQIILGPGTVNHVSSIWERMQQKQRFEYKKHGFLHQSLRHLANIFVPIIPALIASGITLGIAKVMPQILQVTLAIDISKHIAITLLQISGSVLFAYLTIIVGYHTAKEFKGTPALGAVVGGWIVHPSITDIYLFDDHLQPGNGGVFSVLLAVYCLSKIEQLIRKRMHPAFDTILTPTITFIITAFLTYLLIMPLCGWLAQVLTDCLLIILQWGGAVAGFLIAATFLPLVVAGLHQGFFPFHLEMILQWGNDPLFPIQAMGGAGQVGAAFAVLHRTRLIQLRQAIYGALPVGLLGIGEPLLYGVTIPLVRPFITACLGAGCGGAVIALCKVSSLSIGVAGLALFPLIDGVEGMFYYGLGLLVAYLGGYLLTYFYGYDEQLAHNFR